MDKELSKVIYAMIIYRIKPAMKFTIFLQTSSPSKATIWTRVRKSNSGDSIQFDKLMSEASTFALKELILKAPHLMMVVVRAEQPLWEAGRGYSQANDQLAKAIFEKQKTIQRLLPMASKRYRAARIIAKAIEYAALKPTTQLCHARLMREYIALVALEA